jgi:dTDP-4-amino-4,6-dideoxygalactose transaminase
LEHQPLKVPIMVPYVGEEEAQAAADAVRSGWLSQGARTQEFEQLVADYVDAPYAVACSNGTTALHLALLAAGVGPGDEVICPSFTYIASCNAIRYVGATPVFVDIDPRTYTIDPSLIERVITPRTKAILPVDQIGLAADLPAIAEIAARRNLLIIEDAAPSLGTAIDGVRVGGSGHADFTCFSFHPRKSVTTGEGGVITLADFETAEHLRKLRSHAASTSARARYESGTTDFELYEELGYNFRLSDVLAAIGIVQMRKLDFILAERRRLAERYSVAFSDLDALLQVPFEPDGYTHTYQSYVVRLSDGAEKRPHVMRALAARGIATRRGVMASHLEPYYLRLYPDLSLPETERAAEETLLLPLYVGMPEDEQDLVVQALLDQVL